MNQKTLHLPKQNTSFWNYSINDVIKNNPTPFYLYNVDLLKQNYLFLKRQFQRNSKVSLQCTIKSNGHLGFKDIGGLTLD